MPDSLLCAVASILLPSQIRGIVFGEPLCACKQVVYRCSKCDKSTNGEVA